METPESFSCKYCGRTNFQSEHAVRTHIRTSFCATRREEALRAQMPSRSSLFQTNADAEVGGNIGNDSADLPYIQPPSPPQKPTTNRREFEEIEDHDMDVMALQMANIYDEEGADLDRDSVGSDEENVDNDEEYSERDAESVAEGANAPKYLGINTWIRDQFRAYCEEAKQKFKPFSKEEVATVTLLHLLKEKNAPMNAYESVFLWHLHQSDKLYRQQTLGDYPRFIGRQTMIKRLVERYNFEEKLPRQKTIKLPVSGTVVKITHHSAQATIQRLLTDPRIEAKDYLFWDGGDPLAEPPEELDYVEDLNTGEAFLDTYWELIDSRGNEQLMPVVIYFDGTAVSHFHDMEIVQVNIALGHMNRLARNKPYCWAPLGYVEKIHEQGGRGRDILAEADHLESQDAPNPMEIEDKNLARPEGVGTKNDQDFHAMMDCILEEFVAMQDGGFIWDHHDPVTGTDTMDIHYKMFVPFLKVDGKEADLACAKYAQRYSTQQICRKCHIPLQEADDHLAKYALKTVAEIKKLVDKADLDGLQQLSQTYLRNAFYKVRFSMGNGHGIHGACPSELLHAFLLGLFKYIRDILFELIGPTTEAAKKINALSQIYGKLFARQSDRTMPGTSFSRGIQVGKLMAKDYRGVLLIILAICRSTKGRKILRKQKAFKAKSTLDDWILLVESMLEWESYLNEPRMLKKDVVRLEKKHRYLMYIMRKVAQRHKGMGLKLLKFHTILHIWEDILQFGVPLEYDTSANESMHKPSKKASKMTQKAADTFNFQTAQRLVEFHLLDLAMEEIEKGKKMWEYYERMEDPEEELEEPEAAISTGETGIKVFLDEKDGEPSFSMETRSKFWEATTWNTDIVVFLLELQDKIQAWRAAGTTGNDPQPLPIYTCHRRNGQVFRGHPNFRGKGPWKDWVWIDWGGGYGRLPGHIWCFVVLKGMPTGRDTIEHGGIALKDGVFAVVETARLDDGSSESSHGKEKDEDSSTDEEGDDCVESDLLTPYLKEVELSAGRKGNVTKRLFYLADTEAFSDPCCMIPDLGGPSNRYFAVKPRNEWAGEFLRWVREPHNLDVMDNLDQVEEDDEVMAAMEEERPKTTKKRAKNDHT